MPHLPDGLNHQVGCSSGTSWSLCPPMFTSRLGAGCLRTRLAFAVATTNQMTTPKASSSASPSNATRPAHRREPRLRYCGTPMSDRNYDREIGPRQVRCRCISLIGLEEPFAGYPEGDFSRTRREIPQPGNGGRKPILFTHSECVHETPTASPADWRCHSQHPPERAGTFSGPITRDSAARRRGGRCPRRQTGIVVSPHLRTLLDAHLGVSAGGEQAGCLIGATCG
jgi:hypothetical protein